MHQNYWLKNEETSNYRRLLGGNGGVLTWHLEIFSVAEVEVSSRLHPHRSHQTSTGVPVSSQRPQLKIHKRWNVTFTNSLIAPPPAPLPLFADHPKVSWFRGHFISKGQRLAVWLRRLVLFFSALHAHSCLFFQAVACWHAARLCSSCCIQVTASFLMKEFWYRFNLVAFWLLIKITAYVPCGYFLHTQTHLQQSSS